jgi:UDP-N-acetylglucosamine 2-epimerase (non-hydrolysing)
MLKLLSVVGARPNFVKISSILGELEQCSDFEHCLVHTGQHYDEFLSDSFFKDLGLPTPDVNLQVGSGSHASQTAEIIKRIEPVFLEHNPQMVLVVGDVNSTIAAALTSAKLGIPVAHIEAGLRSFDRTMPEEINRKLTDAISTLLFVTEQSGVDNLLREGVSAESIFLVGNVMIDCLLRHRDLAGRLAPLEKLGISNDGHGHGRYGVLTLHRPSNVESAVTLERIFAAVKTISEEFPVFFPVHPRTRKNIDAFGLGHYLSGSEVQKEWRGIVPLRPLGYLEFLALLDHASIVMTDSGGIQEETTVLGVPCLTLRENTERPATVEHGTNQIVGTRTENIVAAARSSLLRPVRRSVRPPLWDGKAAARIVAIIRDYFARNQSARLPQS